MATDNRSLQKIKTLLQDAEVQAHIRENIRKGREEAKVTIGRASELFNIKPSKLRELDALLQPERSTGTETGQRQYSLAELKKLAVISELLREGHNAAEIPLDIDRVWQEVTGFETQQAQEVEEREDATKYPPINQRIKNAREDLFWRYFASRALRLSLMLIREGLPSTTAGLILPLHTKLSTDFTPRIEDLANVGESLVGWLSRSNSSHTLLTSVPSFQHGDDYYRIQRLQVITDNKPEGASKDSTLILLDRHIKHLTLTAPVVETIQSLLSPLYEEVQQSRSCFGFGMRDELDPSPDFDGSAIYPDIILNGLADMIVRLGGSAGGKPYWRFCCILLPATSPSIVSLQQSPLVVRAQSALSPHQRGITTLSSQGPAVGLSIKAYQSGRIIYRPKILPHSIESSMIALGETEGPIRSAIAIPIGGEDGLPIGAIYTTSYEPEAFSDNSQRLLRLIGRMVEELVRTYRVRNQVTQKITSIIEKPSILDAAFEWFPSENEFYRDVEALLQNIKVPLEKRGTEEPLDEVVSLIAIDVDNQGIIANRYGDRLAKNLSREIGIRIQRRLGTMFTNYESWRLYHIYADKFYILLRSVPLEKAQEKAERLRQELRGSHQVDGLRPPQTLLSDSMQVIPDITVSLGVSSYSYDKLREVLDRYPEEEAVDKVRALIIFWAERSLEEGRVLGGDVVMAWNKTTREFVRWLPPSKAE